MREESSRRPIMAGFPLAWPEIHSGFTQAARVNWGVSNWPSALLTLT